MDQAVALALDSVMCSAIPNLTSETVSDSRADARVCKGQHQLLRLSQDMYQAVALALDSIMCSAKPNLTAETISALRAGTCVCKGQLQLLRMGASSRVVNCLSSRIGYGAAHY